MKSIKYYTPDSFDIVHLNESHMEQVEQLLADKQQSLPEDDKHFLKPQSLSDLFGHLAKGFPVIGSVDKLNGRIAAVLMVTPAHQTNHNPHLKKYPEKVKQSGAGIISSVATADGYGGQAAPLLRAAEDSAIDMGLSVLFAKVAMKNGGSGKRFMETGYEVELNGFDPDKGYAVSYWRKALSAIAPSGVTVFNNDHVSAPSLSPEPLSPV